MNICMLTRALPAHRKGGVPDHSWMLARGLAARGHSVSVLTTSLAGSPGRVMSDGVEVHYLEGTRPGEYAGGWWKASASSAARLHRERPFDLFHCQSSAGYGVVNSGLHRSLGVPAAVTQHGTYYDELVTRLRNGFTLSPVRAAGNIAAILYVLRMLYARDIPYLRRADGVIATSREQYGLIRRIYGIPEGRLYTVYNGMDLTLFTPGGTSGSIRGRFGIPGDAPLLLCVARLIRDKGVQNILRALPAVTAEFPACRLLIVGTGPYRAGLERLAEKNGVAGAVTFAGDVEFADLPLYFRECDLFVNATNQQNGYDLTMVEAMACGKTVISSDIGSTPTLIDDGVDGVLVPTGDARALAGEVVRLLRDPRLRETLGGNGREKVTGRFDLETMLDGTLAVYGRLLAGSGVHTG